MAHTALCRWVVLTALVFLLLPLAAAADAPLPEPSRTVACSEFQSVCAESDPKTGVTRVVNRSSGRELWTLAGWHRWMFISNDGQFLAVAHEGLNLIPADAGLTQEVMRLYRRGRLVRAIRLSDLYASPQQWDRSASHAVWVESIAVTRANLLVLKLPQGATAVFSMSTGQRQSLTRAGE